VVLFYSETELFYSETEQNIKKQEQVCSLNVTFVGMHTLSLYGQGLSAVRRRLRDFERWRKQTPDTLGSIVIGAMAKASVMN